MIMLLLHTLEVLGYLGILLGLFGLVKVSAR